MFETIRSDPWVETGTILEKPPPSVYDALVNCGLDWSVSKRKLFTEQSPNTKIRDTVGLDAVLQVENFHAVTRDDNDSTLGIVTDRYELLQNVDGFSYLDHMLDEVEIVTAGCFDGGKTVWVLAKVPDHILIGGNPTEQYILFRNGHDGKTSAGYCLTPIVVVCKNTLSLAWRGTKNKYAINHTGDTKSRIKEASKILEVTNDYYSKYALFGDRLAHTKLSEKKLLEIFMQVLYPNGVGDSDRAKNSAEAAKLALEQIRSGPTLGNAQGTKWGAVNAIGEYLDWYRPTRGDSDRFARINFEATNPKQKALELILDA